MEFTLTDTGLKSNELVEVEEQLALIDNIGDLGEARLYCLFQEAEQSIIDCAKTWGKGVAENILSTFMFHEYAGRAVRSGVLRLMFSGQFNVENMAGALLWSRDREFIEYLLLHLKRAENTDILFKRFGIDGTPLADALIEVKGVPMGTSTASEFIYQVLFNDRPAHEAFAIARAA